MLLQKVIGIDPGLAGAVACITCGRATPLIDLFDTPTFPGANRTYDYSGMADVIKSCIGTTSIPTIHVVIELVHALPGQGVVSMFTFGMGFGIWKGIIAAFNLEHTYVSPAKWKRAMLIGVGDKKQASLQRAAQLFPSITSKLRRQKDEGRAEALLIATWGKQTLTS